MKTLAETEKPSHLLRVFILFSLLSLLMLLFLTNYGLRAIFTKKYIEEAEHDAVSISKMIYRHDRDLLTTRLDGEQVIKVLPENFSSLDRSMRNHLSPLGILKIKMFSREGKIVYSTDHSIIGMIDAQNEKLQRALQGEVVSELETKERAFDIEGEDRFDLDVVETYLPVRNDIHEIIGSFEVYLDITRYREGTRKALLLSMVVVSVLLIFVFGFLIILMRRGTIRISGYQSKLRHLAVTDELTGLFNRRHIFSRAQEEVERNNRLRGMDKPVPSTGYVIVDIDNFKKVNDSHGHLAGDDVLRETSKRLNSALRKYDCLGRYGGKEFIAILPQSDFESTRAVAERICDAVRGTPFNVHGHSLNITVSAGISCFSDRDKDVDTAINRADQGLHQAKRAGKDRVAWV